MGVAAFFGDDQDALARVYRPPHRQQISDRCCLHPDIISSQQLEAPLPLLEELEVIFSTWGMPRLSPEHVARMPRLRAVFYAAGSVKAFAPSLLARDVIVVSAWGANAASVAEFTIAQILLANKGYFRNVRDCATPEGWKGAFKGVGNYDAVVALLGAGMVGRKVIEFLKPFRLRALVFDPYLSREEAKQLGVEKVSIEDAFARADVVSNHLADVPETRGMLRALHFSRLPENAVFINTGRGATLLEDDLVKTLQSRPDLTALLDVTHPEPPAADSLLYKLPNVMLSSHIAGAIGNEVMRLAEVVIEEYDIWRAGGRLRYAVTADMLARMA